MRETNEKQAQILDLLRNMGYYAWRQNSGKINIGKRWISLGNEGLSDIVGFHRLTGRVVAIECKQAKERITDAQKEFLDTVEKSGGIALIAYNVEDIAESLAAIARQEKHERRGKCVAQSE